MTTTTSILENQLQRMLVERTCAEYIDNTARRNVEVARLDKRIAELRTQLRDGDWRNQAASLILPLSISVMGGWLFANLFMH